MPDERVEVQHVELLRAIDEVAQRDAAGVATMYRAAEKVGLNTCASKQTARSSCGSRATSRKPATSRYRE